jgi:hypothetical protein
MRVRREEEERSCFYATSEEVLCHGNLGVQKAKKLGRYLHGVLSREF